MQRLAAPGWQSLPSLPRLAILRGLESPLVFFETLFEISVREQRDPEVPMGIGECRRRIDRLAKRRDRCVHATRVLQYETEIVVRRGVQRIEADRIGVCAGRARLVFEHLPVHAEIVAIVGDVRREVDRAQQQRFGVLRLALAHRHHAQVADRFGVVGLVGEDAAMQRFRGDVVAPERFARSMHPDGCRAIGFRNVQRCVSHGWRCAHCDVRQRRCHTCAADCTMTLLVTFSASARTRIVATGAGRRSDGRDDGGLATENRVEQVARIRIRRGIRRNDRLQQRDRFVDATQRMQIDRKRQRIARLQHVGRRHRDERVEIARLEQHPHVAEPLEPQRCSDRCVIAMAESLRQLGRCTFRIAQQKDHIGRTGTQRRQHIGIGWK